SASCGAARYFLDETQMREFLDAGPVGLELDREAMMRTLPPPGPYRVGPGDILEIRGPHAMFARADQVGAVQNDTCQARVDADGNVQVPLAGTLEVRGRTLLEVEAAIGAALHPRFLVTKPAIVVRVVDYQRVTVTVLGAVEAPGVHELRTDQL